MAHAFILALLAAVIRALLVHGCGQIFQMIVNHFVPDVPPVVCVTASLLLGVFLIEFAEMFWRSRAMGPGER